MSLPWTLCAALGGCVTSSPSDPPPLREDNPPPTAVVSSVTDRESGVIGPSDEPHPSETADQEPAVAAELDVPRTAVEARRLWDRNGRPLLPLLATFFQMVDLTGDELQGSFELLREISAAVPPDDPAAPSVLTATLGFLRLPRTATVELPAESTLAPWKYVVRLLVGLRTSRELGPRLVDAIRVRTNGPLDQESEVIRNVVYGIAYLAYLPGSAIVRRYARESRGLESQLLAVEMLALLGDPRGASVVRGMIETSYELVLVQSAARTLQLLAGEAAEPALAELLRRDAPALQRAALGPLLSICTPSSLRRIIALKDTTDDRTTQRTIELHLKRYGRPLELTSDELEELIRSSPEDAARRMAPYAHRLEVLGEDDQRLSRDDLTAVLEHWKESGTLYTPEWSWVRDRHIVSIATPDDEPALEAVRRAVLREVRATSLNEAHIVQRMILAIRRASAHNETDGL